MSGSWCWRELGIAATEDVRAVRRAYAAKLKTIDTDSDAEGFQRLRSARDEAMFLAENPEFATDDDADDDFGLMDEAQDAALGDLDWADDAAFADTEWHGLAAVTLDRPGSDADDDAPWATLYDRLRPDDYKAERDFPDAVTADAIRAAYDAIVADPRMERIDFHDRQDRWIADIIAQSWPTSEPIVAPAVTFFGWDAAHGRIDQHPSAAFAVQRVQAIEFERQVVSPRHKNFEAWRELTKPATPLTRRGFFLRSTTVNALIQRVRRDYPTLERRFDPHRLALWDRPEELTPTKRNLLLVVLVMFAINVALRLTDDDDTPAPLPVRTELVSRFTTEQALEQAIAQTAFKGQVTLEALRTQVPGFYRTLTDAADAARRDGTTSAAFDRQVGALLAERAEAVLRAPPYPILRTSAQLLLAEAEAATAKQDWAGCTAILFGGGTRPALPPALRDRTIAVAAQALAAEPMTAKQRAAGETTRLTPAVSKAIRARVTLSDGAFKDALLNKGAAEDNCRTRIAAIQVALEQPRADGEALLRALAG